MSRNNLDGYIYNKMQHCITNIIYNKYIQNMVINQHIKYRMKCKMRVWNKNMELQIKKTEIRQNLNWLIWWTNYLLNLDYTYIAFQLYVVQNTCMVVKICLIAIRSHISSTFFRVNKDLDYHQLCFIFL